MPSVSLGAAFLAGLASFLSPCVLPLVPGYISFMSGLSVDEITGRCPAPEMTRRTVLAAACFVLGFALVFTALGASASFVGRLLAGHGPFLGRIAGLLVIGFGLHTSGMLTIPWLYRTKRIDASGVAPGLTGAFLMGLAFAFGWTPCIGPILAAILTLAATQHSLGQGVLLLFTYSLGLGIPFILTALALEGFLRLFAKYKRFLRWSETAAGLLLISMGLLMLAGRLTWVLRLLPPAFYGFSL